MRGRRANTEDGDDTLGAASKRRARSNQAKNDMMKKRIQAGALLRTLPPRSAREFVIGLVSTALPGLSSANISVQPQVIFCPERIVIPSNLAADLKARPFLRWAGGKTRLLPELRKRVPLSYHTYYEPFLGGGSLFFDLKPKLAILSDINPELINAYQMVRDNVEALIVELRALSFGYRHRGDAHYREVRALEPNRMDDVSRAARLIYLNKTCFNGLYRTNKSGQFNTPPGKFKSPPTICDADNLRACSMALSKATLLVADFSRTLALAETKDFVYFDPPYVPLSGTANFTSYAKEGFGSAEQKKLAEIAEKLKYRGVNVLLSNSGTDEVVKLYEGFEVEAVLARRNINCSAGKRGFVKEYLIR